MPTLTEMLIRGPLNTERSSLRRALRHPSCWPAEAALDSVARRLRPEGPDLTGSLLLAEDGAAVGGSLWALVEATGSASELASAAHTAWMAAWAQAQRTMPALTQMGGLAGRPPASRAELLGATHTGRPPFLEGPSYGLPMLITAWGRLAGVAPRADVAATGVVDPYGGVTKVEGVKNKVAALVQWGGRVGTLLVPTINVSEAEAARDALGSGMVVKGIRHVLEAVQFAFPTATADLARLVDPDEQARRLFSDMLMAAYGAVNWTAIAEFARSLSVLPGLTARAQWQAEVAGSIALRWARQPQLIPRSYGFEQGLGEDDHTVLLAHALQAHTDLRSRCPADELAEMRAEAAGRTTAYRRRLLGALGRYAASQGDLFGAAGDSRSAVDAWLEHGPHAEATYPLSELARVAGVAGNRAELVACEASFGRLGGVPPLSRCFVLLAIGRAWVVLGELKNAHKWLVDQEELWTHATDGIRGARWRWQARLVPSSQAAADLRKQLQDAADLQPAMAMAALLARVDAASDEAAKREIIATNAALAEFASLHPGAHAQRIADMYPD